jgi:uncharacterized protein HemX
MSEPTATPADSPATALESIGKKASSVKSIATALGALLVAGAAVLGLWIHASVASQVQVYETKSTARHQALEQQVQALDSRVARVETKTDEIKEIRHDVRLLLEQSIETARRVGARIVPTPTKREP